MQLKYIAGLKPITISGLLIANTSSACSLDHSDKFSSINISESSSSLSNYVKDTQSVSYSEILLKTKFQDCLNRWSKKTMMYSSVQQIIGDRDFLKIVSMGESVVPLIISELQVKPSLLVWALNHIYDTKITNRDVTIEDACKLWIKKKQ